MQQGNQIISKVAELMDPLTGSWDVQLVAQTFYPEDAKIILQIPIRD
jgi:hypothetical protein